MEKNSKKFQPDDPFEDPSEECCDNPTIDCKDGQHVCLNCGYVIGRQYTSLAQRAYTVEEINNRARTEPVWRDFGPRTMLPKKKYDGKGKKINGKEMTLFNRLSKVQNSLISGIERNFWDARPKLKMISTKLNIPKYIREIAWKIYSEAARQKLTMGRSIEGFVAASIYASIRIHGFPRILGEVTEATICKRRMLHRCLSLIIKEVLPKLKLSYKPITAHQLIYKFGNDLYLPMDVQKLAADLLSKAIKNGLQDTGKDPRGLASSALYLAAKSSYSRRTQKEIANVAKITEVTLRSRAKDIRSKL